MIEATKIKDIILARRSIRRFTGEKIPREYIKALAEVADNAPSACNRRPLKIYFVEDEQKLERLLYAGRFTKNIAKESTLAIIIAGDMEKVLPRSLADYWIQDASAATENVLIMAEALGLGACWCGAYPQKDVEGGIREILSLPESIVPLSLIRLGFPAEKAEPHSGYDSERVKFI